MEQMFWDMDKECYELVQKAEWKIALLRNDVMKSKYYEQGIKELSLEDIMVKALNYAKSKEYVDTLVRKIARKNNTELAYKVFRRVFPSFNRISDLYDYCYTICISNSNIKSVSRKMGISVSLLKYYARESNLGLIHEDAKRLEKRKKTVETKHPVYFEVINFLREHDKLEEIVEYFDHVDPSFKGKFLLNYVENLFTDKETIEIGKTVMSRYRSYASYKQSVISIGNKTIQLASDTIDKFVNGIYPNIFSFCTIEKIDKKRFKRFLAIVKRHCPELYNRYQEKSLKIKNHEYSISFLELKEIVHDITYGINGKEFTILDYLSRTDYGINTFYHLVEHSLNEEQFHAVTEFFRKYRNMEVVTSKYLLREEREFFCDLDSQGMPIPGTGHTVTKEEKMYIINKIKEDGFLLFVPVYNLYLKEYFNEEKAHVLKKSL